VEMAMAVEEDSKRKEKLLINLQTENKSLVIQGLIYNSIGEMS